MQFFLPMIPPTVTQQEHKVAVIKGKPVFYDPPELAAAKNKLSDAQEINGILEHLPGWERTNARFGSYGKQRGFIRKRAEH